MNVVFYLGLIIKATLPLKKKKNLLNLQTKHAGNISKGDQVVIMDMQRCSQVIVNTELLTCHLAPPPLLLGEQWTAERVC